MKNLDSLLPPEMAPPAAPIAATPTAPPTVATRRIRIASEPYPTRVTVDGTPCPGRQPVCTVSAGRHTFVAISGELQSTPHTVVVGDDAPCAFKFDFNGWTWISSLCT